MRVLVIGNHDPQTFGAEFEADLIAAGWRAGAPGVEVQSFAFNHCAAGLTAVWQHHAVAAGGFTATALIDACDPDPDLAPSAYSARLAQQFYEAVTSGMSRVVVGLPQFLEPDAGVAFLFALGGLLQNEPNPTGSIAKLAHLGELPAVDTVVQAIEHVDLMVAIIQAVRDLSASVDVVVAYASNMPLMGMHGMSGAAALEGFLDAHVAQSREREISELFHLMSGPYDRLSQDRHAGHGVTPPLLPGIGAQGASASLKDLTRHDGAGAGGGLGFALATVGGRLLPAATVFATQFGLREAIAESDVVVVYEETLDGRTFPDRVGNWAAQVAIEAISPVIILTHHQIMSVREMSSQQVASAYLVERDPRALMEMGRRLAKSWTPNRA